MSTRNKKRKTEVEKQSLIDWEEENIFPKEIKNEMESMWEIPQIFQFLHLAKEALNIPHLSMYEMERMLLIPKASKQLANIMTSLLSSPITKAKLRKIPPMPYEFWTNILAYKVKSWFKVYEAKHQDVVKILETIGVEPEFWNIFPDAPLLNGKDFEELTFRQKVWLLKTVCDTVMHTRKAVQEEIAKQPLEDQFETVLGTDRYGARYIYFPQFLKSDLRVYRQCYDNKIFSTVTVPPSKKTSENEVLNRNDLIRKQTKRRKRRLRWSNGLPPKLKKKGSRCEEKHLNDCKCGSDSATGSLINDDTNLSSISTCSNNNSISNNKNINLNTINVKRSRSSSKCSEVSTESDKTHCTKSSGYDTNSSGNPPCENKSSQKMFKGFSNDNDIINKKCNENMIGGMLNDLKSKLCEEKDTEKSDVDLTHNLQNKLELTSSKQQCLDTINLSKNEPIDRTIGNLSSVSKTDDEKLNEIISAEGLKFNEKSNVHAVKKTQQTSTSKSDDEKLSETKDSYNVTTENTFPKRKEENNASKRSNGQFTKNKKSNNLIINDQKINSKQTSKISEIVSNEDCDLSLNELRCMLQKEAMNNNHLNKEYKVDYNFRKLNSKEPNVWKQEENDFNKMLLELSSSKFQLVADSVNSLRDLISTFSLKSNNSISDTNGENESTISTCEVKLIKKMTELLVTVEKIEPTLRESARRARGKLQKEWTNFKEGSAEDQDSSGEGLNSNWWVLGSQNCPLSTSGDSTLQTLSISTLSSTGCQNISNPDKNYQEHQCIDHIEYNKNINQECQKSQDASAQNEAQGSQSERGEGNDQSDTEVKGETKENTNQEETEVQSRRVLRARGISSYTFYSDDEVEENELEEWTDVEAVYAAPNAQTDSSTSQLITKVRNIEERTNEEDSDQDWILPSSRKRKNKRPSASRRLKSFQHKLQNIKVDALQRAAEPVVDNASSSNIKTQKQNPKIREIQIFKSNEPIGIVTSNACNVINNHAILQSDPKDTVPSVETICKIENIESVHSELDIKEENPVYDPMLNQYNSSYATNFNSNYVMLGASQNSMNYYVMQPNPVSVAPQNAFGQPGPVVSNLVSPIQQGYYVQGDQNYIIQNPQSNFIPSQPLQSQGPQMITPQQFINQPSYIPYMVTPAGSHPEYVAADHQIMAAQGAPQNTSMLVQPTSTPPNRPPQNRYPTPRQYPHLHDTITQSSMPIRSNTPRVNNGRTAKNVQQARGIAARVQKQRKPRAPSENVGPKTTSLIVLSDSDDEIEMIITERTNPVTETEKVKTTHPRNVEQSKQNVVTITSDNTTTTTKSTIPPQIIERMSQGGISITPIKSTPPVQNTNTQLVVVVNETGSHYALALPNGSKLILTPEQVAQIRASNGGKLIL